jgi:2-amino-4-hydroxy-6-hydroxymethyldihydropteridine diphosphokinase
VPWEPGHLLRLCEEIERRLGRTSKGDRAPRTIDLDLLVYGDRVLRTEDLVLPHPRMAERRFVLAPLAEIDPDLVVPGTGTTVRDMLESCTDTCAVHRLGSRR